VARSAWSRRLTGLPRRRAWLCSNRSATRSTRWSLPGLNLQEAIDAPNHHTEAFPSSFYPRQTRPRHLTIEERVGEKTVEGLRRRGHDVDVSPPWSLGRVSAAGRERDGVLKAAANPRSAQGYAAGR
jgi:gamma-glutamyltranspeptidase/glutathione hydrolase